MNRGFIALSTSLLRPADYPSGIIGGYLPNFPSFRDGVALGPYLEEIFKVPVFINNDGDLFAYGEALAGALPEINAAIKAAGTKAGKEYAGDKFEKVIYLESKWRTLKNPQYPYNIIGYVLNCATVTKRGDKRQLQYTVLTKSPDGSRYFMQAASDASYYNLK